MAGKEAPGSLVPARCHRSGDYSHWFVLVGIGREHGQRELGVGLCILGDGHPCADTRQGVNQISTHRVWHCGRIHRRFPDG